MATEQNTLDFLVELGDGEDPEVFSAPCALRTRGIDFSSETTEEQPMDCSEPDKATWIERLVKSLSAGVSGSGRLALEDLATWRTWHHSAARKNIRVNVGKSGETGAGYWTVAAVITSFKLDKTYTESVTIEVSLASSGEPIWTDVP